MPVLELPDGFDSEASFALWEASVADKYPAFDERGQRDYWRHLRLRSREQIPDHSLRRVAERDSDPAARRLAAAELRRRHQLRTAG